MKDKWIRIIGIPIVALLFMLIYKYNELDSWTTFARAFLISLTITTLIWEGNRQIIIFMRKRYPGSSQTAHRLVRQIALSVLYTFFISYVVHFTFFALDIPLCHPSEWLLSSVVDLIPTLFVMSLYESAYFFNEWKKNISRSEMLAKESLRSQLDALKNQIDPHFLFNSLNTLAALIDEQNETAQKYLEQLSDVYRYVLLNKEKETISLEEELTFVESYLYLNKTRFRDNLVFENHISLEARKQQIAPLSLQMLVENALKHNIVSKENPLTLRLSSDEDGYITVENNIQLKSVLEKSTRTGLQNIVNRYALLTTRKIEIFNRNDTFSVKVPLLAAS
jgi:sensor histidine kinase YesM